MSSNRNRKRPTDRLPANSDTVTVHTPKGVIRIRKFNPTAGFLRKHRNASEIDTMMSLVENHASEKALAVFDELSIKEMKSFFEEWQELSGVDLGE